VRLVDVAGGRLYAQTMNQLQDKILLILEKNHSL
jgi:hypothetical protein